jgi:hypothetical protein
MRPAMLLLAAVLAATVAACPPRDAEPVAVPLSQLVADQDAFDGRLVRTVGVVRSHDEPLHYWVEDDRPNRVELVPHEQVADLVGQEVEVTGRFTFSADRGRVIEVETIEPTGTTPEALSPSASPSAGR